MKSKLRVSIIIFSLLSLTQLSLAELKIKGNEVKNDIAKTLKVESNSTKIGEGNSLKKPKTRALRIEHPNDSQQNNANLNVGKIEFYVK